MPLPSVWLQPTRSFSSDAAEIVARSATEDDEVVVHTADLDLAADLRRTMFNLGAHRRPEHYGLIVDRVGVEDTPAN